MTEVGDIILSNELLDRPAALRERMDREGYLFFRRLFEPAVLRDIRRQILEVCREAGLLAPDSALDEALPAMSREDVQPDVLRSVQHRLFGLEAVHVAFHSTTITSLAEKLIGEPIVPHVHKQVRVQFPIQEGKAAQTTAAHQDFVYNQGSQEVYTCWVPLGDVPREAGGLQVVAGSHKHGVLEVHAPTPGSITLSLRDEDIKGRRVAPDYEIGDAIVFHSLTVHGAPPNRGQSLRLSMDCRYQALAQPFSEVLLKPLPGVIDAYPRWTREDLKYYWQKLDLKSVAHDYQYLEKGDREILERARGIVRQIVDNPASDPARREVARQALPHLDQLVTRQG